MEGPPLSVAWFRVQTLGDNPWELHDACAVQSDGKVVFFGGQGRYLFKYNDDVKIYHPARTMWETGKEKPISYAYFFFPL